MRKSKMGNFTGETKNCSYVLDTYNGGLMQVSYDCQNRCAILAKTTEIFSNQNRSLHSLEVQLRDACKCLKLNILDLCIYADDLPLCKYCVVKKPEIRRRSLAPNQIRYFALTDTTYNKEKMGLLSNLHDASEFVMFLKNNLMESIKLSDQNFSRISNEVYQKFVFDNEGNIDSEILTPNIVRITCDLDSRNEELYKNQIPLKKIYETKTRMHCNKINKDESIQTILVSSSPIFPETVCANNLAVEGEPSNKLENKSFVSIFKMTKFGLF